MAVTSHDVMGDQSGKLIDDTVNFYKMITGESSFATAVSKLNGSPGQAFKRKTRARTGWVGEIRVGTPCLTSPP